MNRTIPFIRSAWAPVFFLLCAVSFFSYVAQVGAQEDGLSMEATALEAAPGAGAPQSETVDTSDWKTMYDGLPARREAIRKVESSFIDKVTKDGPPTPKLSDVQQEQLSNRILSASTKMESVLNGLQSVTADAERLAFRVEAERSVVLEDVHTKIQNIRTILSDTRGDIAMFSNLASYMIQAGKPLSLYPDVREASSIVYEQLKVSRAILVEITGILTQNSL